jgi:two-component system chemotaxis sensor kinase CheA
MTIEIPARPRIDADDFDALAFVAEPPPVEPQPAEPQPIAPAPVEPPPVLDAAVVKTSRSARAVRVRTDWLDGVLSRTADLRLIAQRLWSLERTRDDPALASAVADLSRVINALHADALDVRMTPLSILTSRLPRVVRDLARQVGKHAQLALNGDDLALDRAIIEGLDAPLTHLVTNAIEHGIETPEERVQRGKAPHGTLTLRCARERDELVLDLEDDGRGVDVAHLAQRAEALGLLAPSRWAAMIWCGCCACRA